MADKSTTPTAAAVGAGKQAGGAMHNDDSTLALLRQFLAHLARGGQFAYFWTSSDKRALWRAVDALPDLNPFPGRDTYLGVHPTSLIPARGGDPSRARATIEEIVAINCLFADFDAKDFGGDKGAALAHVEGLQPAPSAVVDSGGGYHAYWLLDLPFMLDSDATRERARQLQARWVALVGGDPGAKDLARVLRLPGTLNHKYTPPRPVTVERLDLGLLYEIDQLEALLPAPVQPAARRNGASPGAASTAYAPTAYASKALGQELDTLRRATNGQRNDTLNRAAFNLGQLAAGGALDQATVEDDLLTAALAVGLGEHEARRTIKSGLDAGAASPRSAPAPGSASSTTAWAPGQPAGTAQQGAPAPQSAPARPAFALTDLGNAERLTAQHGDKLRYCYDRRAWLVWTGQAWQVDTAGAALRLAKATVRGIYGEAAATVDDAQRAAVAKHARASEARQRLDSMLALAQSELPIPARLAAFDGDPWRLNCENGILDLRTGDLLPHDRGAMCSKLAPVPYDPLATCPTWHAFLTRILAGNVALIEFLQRAIGYSLTGDVSEQVLLVLYGSGANGKSTLLATLLAMLGDYGQRAPRDLLIALPGQSGAGASPEIARLAGTRLAVAQETESGNRLAEVQVKELTGGDKVVARHLHQNYIEFWPTHKLWLATNHKPVVRGTDTAIWRRIRLIPFGVEIPDAERDQELPAKLRAELPGIFAWAVEGCLDWQRFGLGAPTEVIAATSAYRAQMDVIGQFLADCCVIDPRTTATKAALYAEYESWCERNGERPLSQRALSGKLQERGLTEERSGAKMTRSWVGVGLLSATA